MLGLESEHIRSFYAIFSKCFFQICWMVAMYRRLLDYYTPYSANHPAAYFHAVIHLETHLKMGWEKLVQICPTLPQGWFELISLAVADRIELMREHWLLKMSAHPKIQEATTDFFLSLDYLGVFLTQLTYDDPFEAELVYQVSGTGCFFRGKPGATPEGVASLQKEFAEYLLPVEYTSFLQIHDGFANEMDVGIFGSRDMSLAGLEFQEVLEKACKKTPYAIHPKSLVPFYQSSNEAYFQCFWNGWQPDPKLESMHHTGNSDTAGVFSVMGNRVETMPYHTFLDWMILYLKKKDMYGTS